MINEQRVRRIKNGIYTFFVLMLLIPFLITIILFCIVMSEVRGLNRVLGSQAVMAQENAPDRAADTSRPDPEETGDIVVGPALSEEPEAAPAESPPRQEPSRAEGDGLDAELLGSGQAEEAPGSSGSADAPPEASGLPPSGARAQRQL